MSYWKMNWLIDLLKWLIPTIIAIMSIIYTIKQRRIVKEELSKKRYLEDALSNLNETIKTIEHLPDKCRLDEESDTWTDITMIVDDILRASFETKKKRFSLNISYTVEDFGEKLGKLDYPPPRFTLPDEYERLWLANLLERNKLKHIFVESHTEIAGVERRYGNSPDFSLFVIMLEKLRDAVDKLSTFEEVYESLLPNTVEKVRQTYATLSEELWQVIWKSKKVEIDLDNFEDVHQVEKFLVEEIMSYSKLHKKSLEISKVASALKEVRKELFLKVS